jgi:hypothetical protein
MKRKIKTSEVVLLLLPAIFLAGAGVFLRSRSNTPTESKLSVNNINFRRLPNRGAKFGRVGITVFVTYEGQEPKWWQKGVRAQWLQLQNMRFVTRRERSTRFILLALALVRMTPRGNAMFWNTLVQFLMDTT